MRIYLQLADLLEYPSEELRDLLETLVATDLSRDDRLFFLKDFQKNISSLKLSALQELYTATFEIQSTTSLDIGFHLFGEAYKRGAFMAKLKATQNALHMLPGSELPDHLTQMLRLLAQLQPVQAAPLIEECLLPGLVSILAGLESVQHPYRVFFEGLKKMLVAQKKALEVVHA